MLTQIQGEPRTPERWLGLLRRDDPAFDRYLAEDVYARGEPEYLAAQKARFEATVAAHRSRFGDRPCHLFRAPGRLNAFLEYLDMCAGDHMSTTIDGDTPVAFSPRSDGTVVIGNVSPIFEERTFSIEGELERLKSAPWGVGETAGIEDNWDNRTRVHPHHGRQKGDHANYVIASYLRLAWEFSGVRLRGAELTFGPSTCPLRAGVSSSSGIVVLAALACLTCNREELPPLSLPALCRLLGEAEWYVGTHGGANDHTTILCNEPQGILYNRHSRRELESTPLPFLSGLRIVLANSLWEANKALGANYIFNLRKGWMDLGDDLLSLVIGDLAAAGGARRGPGWVAERVRARFGWPLDGGVLPLLDGIDWTELERRYRRFGSLDETILGVPQAAVAQLIELLPRELDPSNAGRVLGKDRAALARDYTLPNAKDRAWRPRNAAAFFNKENVIGRAIEKLLCEARGTAAEAEYDAHRLALGRLIEDVQETIREDFMISNDQLDLLLAIARDGPGYVAGKLTGAGSGGCVCVFVRERAAEDMCAHLDRAYYGVGAHFDRYREELASVEDEVTRAEMERNLEAALADVSSQRRVVSFSRGAGPLRAKGT